MVMALGCCARCSSAVKESESVVVQWCWLLDFGEERGQSLTRHTRFIKGMTQVWPVICDGILSHGGTPSPGLGVSGLVSTGI